MRVKLGMVLVNVALFLFLLQHVVAATSGLAGDKNALLRFKSGITTDPFSALSNWNNTNNVCDFNGVTCDTRHHRVSRLVLNDSHLAGPLSPFLSNLTGLRVLWLINCRLSGTIPEELSNLRNLRSLRLEGNDFSAAQVPVSLFRKLPKVKSILLLENRLNGTLSPDLFTNCSSKLEILDFSGNFYQGRIPVKIGNCVNLWSLNLYNNQFTGQIPLSLANTSLQNLDVEYNAVSGELPTEVLRDLPELLYLHLSYNEMRSHRGNTDLSPFFAALENCTHLEELEAAGMGLGGTLESLDRLGIELSTLLLQENRITGSIPSTISNLSALVTLNLTANRLSGTVPRETHALPMLEQLFLSHNKFSGPIPEALGNFRHLGLLDLSHNGFSGKIPWSLGNLSALVYLFLNNNGLSGEIPPSLGRCDELHKIDLSHNGLTGKIPPGVLSGMSEIRIFLNLSHNRLEGPFPDELSKLKDVMEIDLSSNSITGSVTSLISSCIAVRLLNFSNNALRSRLPDTIGELKNLEVLDLSRNSLSGPIPSSLNESLVLKYLDLSFNEFSGAVPSGGVFDSITPDSFLNNTRLCGTVPGLRRCSRKKNRRFFHSRIFLVVFSLVIFISVFFSIICCTVAFRRAKAVISSRKLEAARRKTISPELILKFPRITYRELREATEGFDDRRLVGSGSYGRVYKGVLSDGTAVAVKVLHVQSGNSTKSFARECQVLKRIRHRNLIRIVTACSLPDFKALVLPYMANGSLDSCLYPESDLNLMQRVNICSDIAQGMAYLHHHSPVRVIHCDLKPSNVLLNDDMTALVSDFGIARLVSGGAATAFENMGNSTANTLPGTIGYIAPEYGYGWTTWTKGDVYSFGVLVLEMVTRKRPTDEMFSGGMSLQRWVKRHYNGRVEKVVDCSLLREVTNMSEVAIGELIELGLLCTQDAASTRPTMLDAADDLHRLKRYLSGDTTATFASSLGISSSTHADD